MIRLTESLLFACPHLLTLPLLLPALAMSLPCCLQGPPTFAMARPSTWLLLAALVLAAACTANAQQRRLMQTQAPYDNDIAAVEVKELYENATAAALATSELLMDCSPQCVLLSRVARAGGLGRPAASVVQGLFRCLGKLPTTMLQHIPFATRIVLPPVLVPLSSYSPRCMLCAVRTVCTQTPGSHLLYASSTSFCVSLWITLRLRLLWAVGSNPPLVSPSYSACQAPMARPLTVAVPP